MIVVVVMAGGQQLDPRRAVDLPGVGGFQGVGHGVLQARAVEDDHVRAVQDLHVPDREGVVVQAAHRLVDHQGHVDVLRAFGDFPGEEVDGIGGGGQGQAVLRLTGPLPGAAGRQGKGKSQTQQEGKKFFQHGYAPFLR